LKVDSFVRWLLELHQACSRRDAEHDGHHLALVKQAMSPRSLSTGLDKVLGVLADVDRIPRLKADFDARLMLQLAVLHLIRPRANPVHWRSHADHIQTPARSQDMG
jgi:hypothetical protein